MAGSRGWLRPSRAAGPRRSAVLCSPLSKRGRARSSRGSCPGDDGCYLETAHLVGRPGAPRSLDGMGYAGCGVLPDGSSRSRPRLRRRVPPGPSSCSVDVAVHGRAVHAAVEDAFAEEWSHRPSIRSTGGSTAFGRHDSTPRCARRWDGDEIAASRSTTPSDRRLGLDRHPRRAAAGAAAARAGAAARELPPFHERGETAVALGVDSENPTGATRLYERAGMRALWQADVWEKELSRRCAVTAHEPLAGPLPPTAGRSPPSRSTTSTSATAAAASSPRPRAGPARLGRGRRGDGRGGLARRCRIRRRR